MKNKLNELDDLKISKPAIIVVLGIVAVVMIALRIINSIAKSNKLNIRKNTAPVYNVNIKSEGDVNISLPDDGYEFYDDEEQDEEDEVIEA